MGSPEAKYATIEEGNDNEECEEGGVDEEATRAP